MRGLPWLYRRARPPQYHSYPQHSHLNRNHRHQEDHSHHNCNTSNQKTSNLRSFSHSTSPQPAQYYSARCPQGQQLEDLYNCLVMQVTTSSSLIAKQLAVTRPMLSTLSCGSWASPAGRICSPHLFISRTNIGLYNTILLRPHRYDNRAADLTKDGMRHGIEGAAAFLIFLSEGILDRPFCE